MNIEVYRIIHFTGLAMILTALGGICIGAMITGGRQFAARKGLMALHGSGLLVMLIAGFGMIARLGLSHALPGWAWTKIILWFVIGVLPVAVLRQPKVAKMVFIVTIAIVVCAAYLAGMKPF